MVRNIISSLRKSCTNFHHAGLVTNIPANMVVDQFGMIGLLTFIRAAETDPNLVSLALGADLTTLGLNLNSEVNLFPTFGGPWAETPCRPQDIDFHVPHEYLTNTAIRWVHYTGVILLKEYQFFPKKDQNQTTF